MRRGFVVGAIVGAVVVAAAAPRDVAARADTAAEMSAAPESITGTPAEAAPSDQPASEPLAPPDIGPPESVWPYESLTPAEQAVVDHARDLVPPSGKQSAYASAVMERSQSARALAAQHILGLEGSLESVGVVP